MLGQFMPGIPEILVVLAIGFVLIGVPVITVIIVFVRDAPPQAAVRGPVGG